MPFTTELRQHWERRELAKLLVWEQSTKVTKWSLTQVVSSFDVKNATRTSTDLRNLDYVAEILVLYYSYS